MAKSILNAPGLQLKHVQAKPPLHWSQLKACCLDAEQLQMGIKYRDLSNLPTKFSTLHMQPLVLLIQTEVHSFGSSVLTFACAFKAK